jgi:hypothetical protein
MCLRGSRSCAGHPADFKQEMDEGTIDHVICESRMDTSPDMV